VTSALLAVDDNRRRTSDALYFSASLQTTISMTELHNKLQWRYATKKMDPSKAVPEEKVDRILEAVRLAPSSSGLQPYEVIVVTSTAVREQIQPVAYGQAQITEGSHLLVFAAWNNYTAERINQMFDYTNAQRGGSTEAGDAYRKNLIAKYTARDSQVNFEHAARQAYIGLGVALVAAAFEEVDSTPMEGFDAEALDKVLGLQARGLRSVAIMPLGYRDTDKDWLVNLPKVRRPSQEFLTKVS